jgi:hypothetical protein
MTSLPAPNRDPGFDINTATNTFYKALADRLKSGQMTLDQARAAQAEMRALQLNPAAANRQAATDIAQRHLQVGQYSPANVAAQQAAQQPQGGLTLAQPAQGVGGTGQSFNPVTAPPSPPRPPEEIMVTPQRMPEIATMPPPPPPSVMPPPPIRTYYDPEGPVMPPPPMPVSQPQELPVAPTQPDMPERHSEYGIPLWMQLGAGPERDAAYAQYMKGQGGGMQPKGIGGMLNALKKMQLPQGVGGMPRQGVGGMPRQGSPNALTIARGPIPLDQQGPPMGGSIGAFLGRQGEAPQAAGMLPRLAEMLNPQPRQPTGVDNATFIAGDPNFRFGETPQVKAPNAQAMAMGGLLRKYYGGGMC